MEKQPLLRMEKISKRFPGVQALENVDFEVYPGEILGFLGENGAGKSTLVKILSGVYTKDQGTIWFGGSRSKFTARRGPELGITTIYQELALVPHLSVAENIFLNREPRRIRQIGHGGLPPHEAAGRRDHGRSGGRDPRRQAGQGSDRRGPADGRDRQGDLAATPA